MDGDRSGRWRVGTLLVGGVLLVAACGGAGGTAGAASPSPVSQPSESAAAAANPSAPDGASASTGAAEGPLCAVAFEPCPIDAGPYQSDPFTPAFTFTVDDGWTNDRNFADGGGISKGPGGIYWSSGITTGRRGETPVEIPSTIEGFTAHLRSFDGFTVSDGPAATIGGEPAVVLDVVTNDTDARALYLVKEDAYNLGPGEKARFYLLEKDGVLVTFVSEAFAEADFDAVMAQSQPVLDSIAWE